MKVLDIHIMLTQEFPVFCFLYFIELKPCSVCSHFNLEAIFIKIDQHEESECGILVILHVQLVSDQMEVWQLSTWHWPVGLKAHEMTLLLLISAKKDDLLNFAVVLLECNTWPIKSDIP